MSLNHELVHFYIRYKLAQKNFPLDHLTLATPPNRTEGGGALPVHNPRVATPHANGTLNGTDLATPPSPPPASTPPTSPPPTFPVRRQLSAETPPTPPGGLELVKEALRDSANEFELRFRRAFSDLSSQLHITPATAYQSFESVMDEVFRDGVNWGRVVGLFAFGGALCVECVEKEMSSLVGRIAEWMTVYLDNHIQPWIQDQGGWERFAEVFGKDAAAESRRYEESAMKWVMAGAALVSGVVVGSLFALKRL
ncbi:Bcl-2-like protein 1 [Merluccius polli]|uniref:Bcl-2-like protein 1 n=1 Tax=Merluccius polli TaxID=89951 RepID=A0AA47N8P5_MERPO|nr:Bcl-2-like protein 1 [Merluccius polli]